MARKITVSHKTEDKMVSISQQCDNVSQKKIIAKSVKRTLGEYSQNMTLEDLSTSNSLISIDILMLQKKVVEVVGSSSNPVLASKIPRLSTPNWSDRLFHSHGFSL